MAMIFSFGSVREQIGRRLIAERLVWPLLVVEAKVVL